MSTRRMVILGSLGLASIIAWRIRLIQVFSFLVAAGIQKSIHSDPEPDFEVLSSEWKSIQPSKMYSPSRSRGMITYHPWYDEFRPSMANRCLAEAAELRAGFIRIDIRWKDLVPDGRNVNELAWNWYNCYLAAASEWYGLEPVIVLSNPPGAVSGFPVDQRLKAWAQYVDAVARRVGRRCRYYQLLNEPNNPVYRIFPTTSTATALLSAAKVIRDYNPEAKTTINLLADLPGWLSELQDLLEHAGEAVDIIGLDYYPGTWTVSSASVTANWNRTLNSLLAKREAELSPLRGRPLAILETGYSTNARWARGELSQVKYFENLEQIAMGLDARIEKRDFLFMGIHELTDRASQEGLDPEAHFGLLRSGSLERKLSFSVVRQIFSQL
jgi:hypothetical protein